VRCRRHGLHSARYDHVELAGPDQLGSERDRVKSGQADLVDRERRDRHRDASRSRGLPRRDLARSGLQHLAHDHVVNLVAGQAGSVQRGLDREAAELSAAEVAE